MSYDEHLITQAGGDGDDVATTGAVQFCHPSVKTEQEAQSATCSNIAAKSWDAIIDGAAPWAEQDEETIRIHTETVRAVLDAASPEDVDAFMRGGVTDSLDAIQARVDAATEGPWCLTGEPEEVKAVAKYTSANGISTGIYITDLVESDEDAEFIAHARTDVPALLALVREQQARIERGNELVRYLDRLAPGDKHYAGLIRAALRPTP